MEKKDENERGPAFVISPFFPSTEFPVLVLSLSFVRLVVLRGGGQVFTMSCSEKRRRGGGQVDFNDTPEEAEWRAKCVQWLEERADRREEAGAENLRGPFAAERDASGLMASAKAWQAQKFDAGFAKISWEPEFGGCGGTPMQQVIFGQEESKYKVQTDPFMIGLGMVAPTIRTCGTDAQRERYLKKLVRGEEVWCQLFSEPGAGSDVASLSTSAQRDGDEWLLSGQKVWTSGAQFSDFGEIICRTDPDAPKHRGITAFIVDMKAPGVTVQPLRQMTGGAAFNEVFFDEVRVPDSNRLGDVNKGWTVAITTLMNERASIGSGGSMSGGLRPLIEYAKKTGKATDPLVRQQLADLHIRSRIMKYNGMRSLTSLSQGTVPGPEGSIGKLFGSTLLTDIGALTMSLLGPEGTAEINDRFDWHLMMVGAPGMHLGGGTDEVMKNIIGERVLQLPGEPRVDKDVAWKDVPKGV